MEQLLIRGGKKLKGEIMVNGAKNAALAILAATVLTDEECLINNVPSILDIEMLLKGIESIGATVSFRNKNRLSINAKNILIPRADNEFMHAIRGSYYLLGALLGRFKEARVLMPGGCNIGNRPIDQHIKGFEALGARVSIESGLVIVETGEEGLKGANIYLDIASVGATINIMMAAALAEGETTIENPAKEPHVVDLANFLNSMGANIKGAGTDIIRIEGVERLHGCEYAIIPDQIEAGTYMVAAAITGGDLVIKNVIIKHLEAISAKLSEMGVNVVPNDDSIRVYVDRPLKSCNVKTLFYPGFPTDMQPQFTALLCLTEGTGIVTEAVYKERFQYVDELRRMGANITVEANTALIKGVKSLSPAEVKATDLRAGAAMVLAALATEGESIINNPDYIDRGYCSIEEKLRAIGADIQRIKKVKKDKDIKAAN